MSNELSIACDGFLRTTSILEHGYGIPDVKKHGGFAENRLGERERCYYELHGELVRKLNLLLVLNKMYELRHASVGSVDREVEQIVKILEKNPLLYEKKDTEEDKEDETGRLEQVIEFYRKQNEVVKTDLTNRYFQVVLPILRSIHSVDVGITSSESVISHNLSKLYSKSDTNKANINVLLDKVGQLESNKKHFVDFTLSLDETIDEIGPHLQSLTDWSSRLNAKRSKLLSIKEKQVEDLSKLEDSVLVEKFSTLVNEWAYLSILCDFLPTFITSLPINWFEDKTLKKIVQKCTEISHKLQKYQLVLNTKNFNQYNYQDLLMLDFNELKEEYNDDD